MKSIVVYYSRTGKTQTVAEAIAGRLKAEIRKIEEIRINRNGIAGIVRAGLDAMLNFQGEIKPMDLSLKKFGRIYLGSPIWAGKPAPAMNGFISEADFKGKNIVLFFTMATRSNTKAKNILTNAIEKKGGKVINTIYINTNKKSDKELTMEVKEILASLDFKKSNE